MQFRLVTLANINGPKYKLINEKKHHIYILAFKILAKE
jgi:hypothetical protein